MEELANDTTISEAEGEARYADELFKLYQENKDNAIGPWAFCNYLMYKDFSEAEIDNMLKEAPAEYQKGIYGYTVTGSTPEDYYVKKLVASQTFGLKDYFWPISTYYLERNPNLVQNLGW